MNIDFWCEHCQNDITLPAFKRYKNKYVGVVWIAVCPKCRYEVIRFTENQPLDPYYQRSRKIQMSVRKYARDLIQPDHPDFDRIYPQHKKEKEEKLQAEERKKWEQQNSLSSLDKKKIDL